jgi:hypothetical protein
MLIVILLLAFALRFYRLGAQSLWNDEGTSVALAQRNLATITRNASHDIHPPLYYYMLHYWIKVAGTTERGVRALSALGGVALVVAVYTLARPFGTTTGLLTAFLSAISPFAIYYSQETRMYIFLGLFGALSVLAYEGFAGGLLEDDGEKGKKTAILRAFFYLLTAALLVYTHYIGFALLFSQNVAFLARWLRGCPRGNDQGATSRGWSPLLYWGTTQCVILIIYLPWLAMSWQTLRNWPGVSAPFSFAHFVSNVCRVLPLGVTVREGLRNQLYGVGLSLLVLPGILYRPDSHEEPGADLLRNDMALYLLLPLVLIFALSLRRPMYKPKFLLLMAPAYHVLQARGILRLSQLARRAIAQRWRWLEGLVAASLFLAVCTASAHSLVGLYTDETFFRDDYRGAVAYIEATSGPQDAIVINAPSQIETVDYYYQGDLPEYPLPKERPLNEERTERALQDIVAQHRRIYGIFWATRESDPQGFVEGWLDSHCYKAMDSWFGNIRLLVYAVPQESSGEIQERTGYVLGEKVRLRGYTLLTPQPESGEIVQLSLFWEALMPLEERYKVFLHLVDERGNIVAQRDTEPGGGRRLTTDWEVGEVIMDNHGILIPAGTVPSAHQLWVGLYDLADGTRLSVQGGEDAIDLQTIPVQVPAAPSPESALDMQHAISSRTEASWGPLCLLGHSLYRLGHEHEGEPEALRPRERAKLTLFWTRENEDTAPRQIVLSLRRKDRAVWQTDIQITGGTFPPGEWRAGEKVRDIHRLSIPDIPPGTYDLTLRPQGNRGAEYRLIPLVIAANDH